MAISYQIQIKNLDKATKNLAILPELIRKTVARSLLTQGTKLMAAATRKAPTDTGRLRSSIGVNPSSDGLTVSVGTPVKYGIYVHEGTKPHYPPISALTGWAKRHGANPYLVQRGIGRKGTKANRFLQNPLKEMEHSIQSEIGKAVDKVLADTARSI